MRKITVAILALILTASFLELRGQDETLKYSMMTTWGEKVDPNNLWNEYPRPQMVRENWTNLNGYWEYAIEDKSKAKPEKFDGKILVPFPVESELSGVKKMVGEHNYLWYRKSIEAPKLAKDERLLIHFGAVDWEAVVYVNGKEAGTHKGGFDPFSFDITDFLTDGPQQIEVRVWDPTDKGTQPRGKQVEKPVGIWYTPVTGIWQTVWLEKVPEFHIQNLKITPDIDKRLLHVEVMTTTSSESRLIEISALADGKEVSQATLPYGAKSKDGILTLSIPSPRLWSPEDPFLYDLKVVLKSQDGKVVDAVQSYFGMRKISLGKDQKGYTRIMLNNKPLFQFGLLDQGWWPDGLFTPPSEEAMLYDVEMTKEMGFNMIRKHVKVEPARFYYQCDKMGMLVWQDMPNGNYFQELRIEAWEKEDAKRSVESSLQFEEELKEMMDDFHSFPSIVVWVPFNEGWGQYDTERIAKWVKNYDPSRLSDTPSGWTDRGLGDMVDIHLYPGPGMEPAEENRASVLGEFGGLGYPVEGHLWWDKKNWGYLTYYSEGEFQREFEHLMNSLKGPVANGLSAAVYTQTTDVEGEVNGLITYDRKLVKVEPKKLKAMIAPLYEDYWDSWSLVSDSEVYPSHWMIAEAQPEEGWKEVAYDDFEWSTQVAPFSSYENPFLESSSEWSTDKLFLRRGFELLTVPENLYLRHYMPRAAAKVYLNGKLIGEYKDQGGRKRHYTDIDISSYAHLLQKGDNVLSVEVEKLNKEASFDVGIYTTRQMDLETSNKKSKNNKVRKSAAKK